MVAAVTCQQIVSFAADLCEFSGHVAWLMPWALDKTVQCDTTPLGHNDLLIDSPTRPRRAGSYA
jgi:hypothetical protein